MKIYGGVLKGGIFQDQPGYIKSGLVYYIDASNPLSYTGSGNTINDISGSTVGPSTLYNSPTFTSASGASYFTFDGSSQYIETADLVSLFNSPSNSNLTLETWIYTTSNNGVIVTEDGQATLDGGWYDSQQEIVSGNLLERVWNVGITGGEPIITSAWNQCVLTYDGTTLATYLNGVAGASSSGTRLVPWENGAPGLYYFLMSGTGTNMGAGNYLAGNWCIFRVYNRALTPQEVQQNFNAGRG